MAQKETARPMRAVLYSPAAPTGQLFTGEEAIKEASENGWVDSPVKIQAEPAPKKAAKAKAKPAANASE